MTRSPVRSPVRAGGLTGLSGGSSWRSSGAIQPSVPGTPERRLKLQRPAGSFLQRPKSERTTLPRPWLSGPEMSTLAGFRSRCTGGPSPEQLSAEARLPEWGRGRGGAWRRGWGLEAGLIGWGREAGLGQTGWGGAGAGGGADGLRAGSRGGADGLGAGAGGSRYLCLGRAGAPGPT